MAAIQVKVRKCPTDELALTNCGVVSPNALPGVNHVLLTTGPARHFVLSIKRHPDIKDGEIGLAVPQRKWIMIPLGDPVTIKPHNLDRNCISGITLTVDFQAKKYETQEPLDSDAMAREFSMQFGNQAFAKGMELVFRFTDAKGRAYNLSLGVKNIEGIDLAAVANNQPTKSFPMDEGKLIPNSTVIFDKEEATAINLVGKSKGKSAYRSIINPDWDFQKMGIGGLDTEFSGIFRRAFASRVFPPEFIEQLGMKHVRGILLFGPPGTGKTLMARQIGKMLNAREPKIVNGPQILDKYVGESESNVRKLFADAEEEWRRCGSNSGLHIIIFDEIDAICKQRGSMAGSSSVHDTVVNQLLSKMDGVEQLNNILVIGMTNRRDMIDEALLRPGRLEVQMEVGLPDEAGRLQIVKIHTARMREYKKLDPNVDLNDLAKRSKNFSGAELEGLVRAAQSSAMNRHVKGGGKDLLDPDAVDNLMITSEDFEHALIHDVKPAFGRADESLEKFLAGGLVIWSQKVTQVLEKGERLVSAIKNPDSDNFVSAVLFGRPRTGKSCLAAEIAKRSEIPFVKVISPAEMVGYTETAKCQMIKKAFTDAVRSPLSMLLIDNLEEIVDYCPMGPRYSNLVLRALCVLLNDRPPQNHRLIVVATTSNREFLRDFELENAFQIVVDVPMITNAKEVRRVLEDSEVFTLSEMDEAELNIDGIFARHHHWGIGIKQLKGFINTVRTSKYGMRSEELVSMVEQLALGI